jgi:hypothetical protein
MMGLQISWLLASKQMFLGGLVGFHQRSVWHYTMRNRGDAKNNNVSPAPQCQLGTSVHKVHVNCVSHVTLLYLLTHLGCVYNRSM